MLFIIRSLVFHFQQVLIMQLHKYIYVAIIVCIVGSFFVFNYFSGESENKATQTAPDISQIPPAGDNERSTSSSEITQSVKPETKQSGNQTVPHSTDKRDDAKKTLDKASQGISSRSTLVNVSGQQMGYMDFILAFLADPYNDEAQKVQAAKKWLKPKNKEETLLLLQLAIDAHEQGQNELKDQLLQVLAGVDSNEPTEALISLMKDEVPGITFKELPQDLQYAIQKAIRLNPDTEWTGQVLAESSGYQSSAETIESLQTINHPTMLYCLAQEADQKGEVEQVEQIVSSLIAIGDPKSLEMIIRLGKENIVSVDDASLAAFDWVTSHQDILRQDQYESYLSESNADSVVRSIAAYTLAASNDSDSALSSLRKAYANESDKNTRYYYEEAINSLTQRGESQSE